MYSLLVLGLIPGTNIQINLAAWLILVGTLAAAVLALERKKPRRVIIIRHELDTSLRKLEAISQLVLTTGRTGEAPLEDNFALW